MSRHRLVALLLAATTAASLYAEVPDRPRLDGSGAVDARELTLDLGPARLSIASGVLVPIRDTTGGVSELAFLGEARFELEAAGEVERLQLWLHSGQERVDVTIQRAVLLIADEGVVAGLRDRSSAELSGDEFTSLERTYRWWDETLVDGLPHLQHARYRAAGEDRPSASYRGVWLESTSLGSLLYELDPREQEQVSLGGLVVEHADVSETPADDKQPPAAEFDVRLDTWLSMPLSLPDGAPSFGHHSFEAEHYILDVSIDPEGNGELSADIQFRAEADGARILNLELPKELEVSGVNDRGGDELPWRRFGSRLAILLPETIDRDASDRLTVYYQGELFERLKNGAFRLQSTHGWLPRTGSVGRPTYDVNFRWPASLELLASGRLIDEGETGDADGATKWQHRILDVPSLGFSFEMGQYDVITEQFGPVELTVAFNTTIRPNLDPVIRQNVVKAIKSSLAFYSQQFGIYPLPYLTVVTVPRDSAQGFLGFVTLGDGLLFDPPDAVDRSLLVTFAHISLQEQRIEVVAHELAHQWWGNRVGWFSYRDQWLSEALATYAAGMFCRKLWPDAPDLVVRQAAVWRDALNTRAFSGHEYASLGPVVIGYRMQFHDPDAVAAVVYDKGSVVFKMLARMLGEDTLLRMLGDLAQAVDNRVITTETFLKAVEHMASADLGAFSRRFVYGVEVPEVHYRYVTEPVGDSWIVRGQARQLRTPIHRLGIRFDAESGWRLERLVFRPSVPPEHELILPFQIAVRGGEAADSGTEAGVGGRLTLTGEITPFEFPLEHEPRALWLDQRGEVLAEFISQDREPRLSLRKLGFHLTVVREWNEARAVLEQALELSATAEEQAEVRLQLARVAVETGDVQGAREELETVERLVDARSDTYRLPRSVLKARVELLRGRYDRVYSIMDEWLDDPGLLWNITAGDDAAASLSELLIEAQLLLGVAAHETRRPVVARQALESAVERGADIGPLMPLLGAVRGVPPPR